MRPTRALSSTIFAIALLGALVATPAAVAKRKRTKRPTGEEVCATFGPAPAHMLLGKGATMESSRFVSMCSFKVPVPNAEKLEKAYAQAAMKHMMKSMQARQRGEKVEKLPRPHLANTVSIVFQGDQKSVAQAVQRMKSVRRTLAEGITVSTTGSRGGGYRSKVAIGKGKAKSTAEVDKITDDVADTVGGDLKKVERKTGRDLPGKNKEVSASFTAQSTIEMLTAPGIDEAHYATKYRNVTARKGKRIITVEVRIGKTAEEEKELALALATEWLKKK